VLDGFSWGSGSVIDDQISGSGSSLGIPDGISKDSPPIEPLIKEDILLGYVNPY
jgi:hypothetical protein